MYSPTAPVGALTVARYVKVIIPLLAATVRPVHVAILPVPVPPSFTDVNVKPIGKISSTDTPVATSGPALVTTNVKVTVSPTFGKVLSILFSILKSACSGTTSSESSSSSSWSPSSLSGSLSGSYWSLAVTSATFLYSPAAPVGALTVASTVSTNVPDPTSTVRPVQFT